jgi:hypothetical protein
MEDKFTTWVLIRDSIVFDGAFDSLSDAEKELKRNQSNYLGKWTIKPMTDAQFKKYMGGNVEKQISDVDLAHGVRFLTRS